MITVSQGSTARDNVLSILEHPLRPTARSMPNAKDFHLQFLEGGCLRCICFWLPSTIRRYSTPPGISYFRAMWKENCSHIKFRKTTRLSICPTCDHLRAVLAECAIIHSNPSTFIQQRHSHVAFISQERKAYQLKREESMQDGLRACSIIFDGADQSELGMPHFTTSTEDVRGQSLKARLIDILEHCTPKQGYIRISW